MTRIASLVLALLLLGCDEGAAVSSDIGAAGGETSVPISFGLDLSPRTLDQALPQEADASVGDPDATQSECEPLSCISSCSSAGVSSSCTWLCSGVTYSVSCGGTKGCSEYSYCTCREAGATVKEGAYSISGSGGIDKALAQAKLHFCRFP